MNYGFFRVAAAAPRLRVADPDYNAGQLETVIDRAVAQQVRLLVTPELSVTGYTCADLFFTAALQQAADRAVQRLAAYTAGKDIAVLIEKLYNQMNNYANQMKSIDASLAFAEEYLKAKNAAFLEGMSSSSDLVDAELNLAKVRTERMQAAYNYDVALAKLLEAAGISDEFISYLHRTDARPIHFDNE